MSRCAGLAVVAALVCACDSSPECQRDELRCQGRPPRSFDLRLSGVQDEGGVSYPVFRR